MIFSCEWMAVQMIEEAGFDVVEAANADDAIVILEKRFDIDAVFTDIDMPNGSMNGLRLAHAVKDRWPPIKIVTTSGQFQLGSKFIPKPYSSKLVNETIRELIEQ
jgi:CheY-like chemotaxis protein